MLAGAICWLRRAPCLLAALIIAATPCLSGEAENLDALVSAYPDQLARYEGSKIYWRDGTIMDASDGKPDKPFDQWLKSPSILDQFRYDYAPGRPAKPPELNFDPGRARNETFFNKMYGDCTKGEVDRQMTTITWLPKSFGQKIRVTNVNGIAAKLKAISAEIDELPPAIKSAAFPSAGVLACRPVADTGRMSMHGYAAAIDLNTKISDYWLWSKKGNTIAYKNRMPFEIVDIFERYGFIWGGNWYHFDTMHFEYRPELIGAKTK